MKLPLLLFLACAVATPVKADACLGPEEARIQASAHHLMVFPEAVRIARKKFPGDTVSANLCRVEGRLMYVLAILAKDGRVVRAIVDPETAAVRQLP